MLSETTRLKLQGLETCSIKGKHRCRDLFKIACESRDLWVQAYGNIYANRGATTPGVDGVSLDGQSVERINHLIQLLKDNRYYPIPSKRVYIPKPNGKTRPLGIPSGADKLVQEVWRILLETIYEPVFIKHSHGFRPKRSCHTALKDIQQVWTGTKWFIEFDIEGYFDNINHSTLVAILEKRINDRRFIAIVKRMLKAGYMEEWTFHKTYSGTPQGGVISPILANIYLHEFDLFAETLCKEFTLGKTRADNPAYNRIRKARRELSKSVGIAKKRGWNDRLERYLQRDKELQARQLRTPSKDQHDPAYRRLRYCRYADDFVFGFIGIKAQADAIYEKVKAFLKEQLDLSIAEDKSRVTHGPTEGVKFLGYGIDLKPSEKTLWYSHAGKRVKKRTMQQHVILRVPKDKIRKFATTNGYGVAATHRATHRSALIHQSDVEIVLQFNAELRGFAQYYALANNAKTELSGITDLGRLSMLKTMAAKHKCSVKAVSRRLKHGHVRGVKHKGKIYSLWTLSKLKAPTIAKPDLIPITAKYRGRTELTDRLMANCCEYCNTTDGNFEVHHVRKLKDVKEGKEPWQELMIARNRKTLVLCVHCHDLLHTGKLPDNRKWESNNKVESRVL